MFKNKIINSRCRNDKVRYILTIIFIIGILFSTKGNTKDFLIKESEITNKGDYLDDPNYPPVIKVRQKLKQICQLPEIDHNPQYDRRCKNHFKELSKHVREEKEEAIQLWQVFWRNVPPPIRKYLIKETGMDSENLYKMGVSLVDYFNSGNLKHQKLKEKIKELEITSQYQLFDLDYLTSEFDLFYEQMIYSRGIGFTCEIHSKNPKKDCGSRKFKNPIYDPDDPENRAIVSSKPKEETKKNTIGKNKKIKTCTPDYKLKKCKCLGKTVKNNNRCIRIKKWERLKLYRNKEGNKACLNLKINPTDEKTIKKCKRHCNNYGSKNKYAAQWYNKENCDALNIAKKSDKKEISLSEYPKEKKQISSLEKDGENNECKKLIKIKLNKVKTFSKRLEYQKKIGACVAWCGSEKIRKRHSKICSAAQKINMENQITKGQKQGQESDGHGRTYGQWGWLSSDEQEKIMTCEWKWHSKSFKYRNWDQSKVCESIAGTALETFDQELLKSLGVIATEVYKDNLQNNPDNRSLIYKYQNYTPGQASYHDYPYLLRLEGVSQFMNAHCNITGKKLSGIPKHCSIFSEGIKRFKCEPVKKEKEITKIVTGAKILSALANKKEDLLKEFKDNEDAAKYPCQGMACLQVKQERWDKYNKAKAKENKILEKIKTIDSKVLEISSLIPILFTDIKKNVPISQQKIQNFSSISDFNKLSFDDKDLIKKFDRIKAKHSSKISISIERSMDKICNTDPKEGTNIKDLLAMKNLTNSVTKRWPQFNTAQECLNEYVNSGISPLGFGGTLLCLAGLAGPQALIVGGLCSAIFTAASIDEYYEEKDNFEKMNECRSAGDAVCSKEEYLKQAKEMKMASDTLMMTIALLPLEFIGAGKAIKKGVQTFRGTGRETIIFRQAIDEELEAIAKLSSTEEKRKRLEVLEETISKDPHKILDTKIARSIDEINYENLKGLKSLKIPKEKSDKFLTELKKHLKGCQK